MDEIFIQLGLVVGFSLGISFICSLMEASLLTVPLPYIKYLAGEGSKIGKILLDFKEDLGKPIAAILILNTVAHTIGASLGGAIISKEGEDTLMIFAIVYTILVLIISEIIPKQLGSIFSRQTSVMIALPLQFIIKLLYPLVYISQLLSRMIRDDSEEPLVSHNEVLSLAELGHEEGVIDLLEDSVIRNVIGLDKVLVRDVLTPRVVVFSLNEDTEIVSLKETLFSFPHSRIPVFSSEEPDKTVGYVTQRDIAKELIENGNSPEKTIKELLRPLETVPDVLRVDKLLLQMVEKQTPITAVIDEYGGFAGIVTIEDILEEIIGKEIVDEFDTVRDLRTYAKKLHELRGRTK